MRAARAHRRSRELAPSLAAVLIAVAVSACGTASRSPIGGQLAASVAQQLDRHSKAVQRLAAAPCHDFNLGACQAAATPAASYTPRGACVPTAPASDRWRCEFRTSDPEIVEHDAAAGEYLVKLISTRCWIVVDVRATQYHNVQGCLSRGGEHQ